MGSPWPVRYLGRRSLRWLGDGDGETMMLGGNIRFRAVGLLLATCAFPAAAGTALAGTSKLHADCITIAGHGRVDPSWRERPATAIWRVGGVPLRSTSSQPTVSHPGRLGYWA